MLLAAVFAFLFVIRLSAGECTFPNYFTGDWFSMELGEGVQTMVSQRKWGNLDCIDAYYHQRPIGSLLERNVTFLLRDPSNPQCYYCQSVLWRTPNVLQVYRSEPDCNTGSKTDVTESCRPLVLPTIFQVDTYFRTTDEVNVNCNSTFEGVYQFTYEERGGGGLCINPESRIRACQEPGSPYIDNEVFRMQFAKCDDVSTSYNKLIRYQCYGTWSVWICRDIYCQELVFAAISDTDEIDNRDRFKCLLTWKNQRDLPNKSRLVMSRFATCSNLYSIYDGPMRLVLTGIPPPTQFLAPKCSLPRNVTGNWFTQGMIGRASNITINDTHIHYHTPNDVFDYKEIYYSCQLSRDSRYLMASWSAGCEVNFTCFDFIGIDNGVVVIAKSELQQPLSSTEEPYTTDYLEIAFMEACSRGSSTWKNELMTRS